MSRAALAFATVLLASCNDTATQPETPEVPGPTADVTPIDGELAAAVNTWTTRANLPGVEREGLTTAVVPNASGQPILYAIGGKALGGGSLGKVQAYNAATNKWTHRASMPIPVYNTNGAGVIGGKIYVSGGVTRDKFFRHELQVYDPATNTWSRKADMPDQAWGGLTGVFGGKLYVLTSFLEEDSYLDRVPLRLFRYDPATDQWTELASSPPQARRPMGGFIGGKLYATGSATLSQGEDALFHAYDPATDQWTSKTPLPRPRFNGIGVTLGAKLYIINGWEVRPDVIERVRTTSVYDPATDAWSERAPIPTDRTGSSGSLVRLNGAHIHVVGLARPGNHLRYTP